MVIDAPDLPLRKISPTKALTKPAGESQVKDEFQQFQHIHKVFSNYGQGLTAPHVQFIVERDQ